MADPKEKLNQLLKKQRDLINAQREASKKLENERLQKAIDETALSFPPPAQPPNE